MKATLQRREKQLQSLLAEGKIAPAQEPGCYEVLYPLSFNSPSMMAVFILGRSANGWDEFLGIRELRDTPDSE